MYILLKYLIFKLAPGADPRFDQWGGPDRDRPKTAILGPQFCRILVLGPHFWWSSAFPSILKYQFFNLLIILSNSISSF